MEKIIVRVLLYVIAPGGGMTVCGLFLYAFFPALEPLLSKGIILLTGGICLVLSDVGNRIVHSKNWLLGLVYAADVPTIYFVPMWAIGFVLVAGGIGLMLEPG